MASRVKVLRAPHLFFSFCRRTGGSQKPRLLPNLVLDIAQLHCSTLSKVELILKSQESDCLWGLYVCEYRMPVLFSLKHEVHFNVSSPLTQLTGVKQANDSHNHFLGSRISHAEPVIIVSAVLYYS